MSYKVRIKGLSFGVSHWIDFDFKTKTEAMNCIESLRPAVVDYLHEITLFGEKTVTNKEYVPISTIGGKR